MGADSPPGLLAHETTSPARQKPGPCCREAVWRWGGLFIARSQRSRARSLHSSWLRSPRRARCSRAASRSSPRAQLPSLSQPARGAELRATCCCPLPALPGASTPGRGARNTCEGSLQQARGSDRVGDARGLAHLGPLHGQRALAPSQPRKGTGRRAARLLGAGRIHGQGRTGSQRSLLRVPSPNIDSSRCSVPSQFPTHKSGEKVLTNAAENARLPRSLKGREKNKK